MMVSDLLIQFCRYLVVYLLNLTKDHACLSKTKEGAIFTLYFNVSFVLNNINYERTTSLGWNNFAMHIAFELAWS